MQAKGLHPYPPSESDSRSRRSHSSSTTLSCSTRPGNHSSSVELNPFHLTKYCFPRPCFRSSMIFSTTCSGSPSTNIGIGLFRCREGKAMSSFGMKVFNWETWKVGWILADKGRARVYDDVSG